jgi:hypothetical protein
MRSSRLIFLDMARTLRTLTHDARRFARRFWCLKRQDTE